MATSHTTPDNNGRQTGDLGDLNGAEPLTTPIAPYRQTPGYPGMAAHDLKTPTERNDWPDQPRAVVNDTAVDNPHGNTPGHPQARGTLPMARYLTDLAIEDEIQALAAEAPLPTVDQAARLARMLRMNRPRRDRPA